MDLEIDTAEIFGKEVNLNLTSSGHYCIPIDKTETLPVKEVNLVNMEEQDKAKQKSTLLKLHRQFAHPPKRKLVAALRDGIKRPANTRRDAIDKSEGWGKGHAGDVRQVWVAEGVSHGGVARGGSQADRSVCMW